MEGGGMASIGGDSGAQASSIRRVGIAGFVGTTMEWYDYFLYGAATTLTTWVRGYPAPMKGAGGSTVQAPGASDGYYGFQCRQKGGNSMQFRLAESRVTDTAPPLGSVRREGEGVR